MGEDFVKSIKIEGELSEYSRKNEKHKKARSATQNKAENHNRCTLSICSRMVFHHPPWAGKVAASLPQPLHVCHPATSAQAAAATCFTSSSSSQPRRRCCSFISPPRTSRAQRCSHRPSRPLSARRLIASYQIVVAMTTPCHTFT